MNDDSNSPLLPAPQWPMSSTTTRAKADRVDNAPAFTSGRMSSTADLRRQIAEACQAWLTRSPSAEARAGYARDLGQFLGFAGIPDGAWEDLARIRPSTVAAWR